MSHRLHATTYLVRSYDEAITWFTGVLGFDLVDDVDLGGAKRWVRVAPAGTTEPSLVLARPGDDDVAQQARIGDQTGGRVGWFLHTDDFAGDHARLLAAGVRFLEEPRHEPYGTVAVFEDLYGNRWDLLEPRLA